MIRSTIRLKRSLLTKCHPPIILETLLPFPIPLHCCPYAACCRSLHCLNECSLLGNCSPQGWILAVAWPHVWIIRSSNYPVCSNFPQKKIWARGQKGSLVCTESCPGLDNQEIQAVVKCTCLLHRLIKYCFFLIFFFFLF